MNYAKRLVRGMRHGEKGFTLIELLIVIAILGIIGAVVALNVGGFRSTGVLQAANVEADNAKLAITACLADAGALELENAAPAWDGNTEGQVEAKSTAGDTYDAVDYLEGGKFKATYVVEKAGTISGAAAGDWGVDNIVWDGTNSCWKKVTPPE